MSTTQIQEPAVTVVKREKLKDGFIVSIKFPEKTKSAETPEGVPYLYFKYLMKGGFLSCHLYGDKEQHERRGNRIWVHVTVWRKELSNGKQFLYLDFYPINTEQQLSHELKIYPEAPSKDTLPSGTVLLSCDDGGKGAIGLLPKTQKT